MVPSVKSVISHLVQHFASHSSLSTSQLEMWLLHWLIFRIHWEVCVTTRTWHVLSVSVCVHTVGGYREWWYLLQSTSAPRVVSPTPKDTRYLNQQCQQFYHVYYIKSFTKVVLTSYLQFNWAHLNQSIWFNMNATKLYVSSLWLDGVGHVSYDHVGAEPHPTESNWYQHHQHYHVQRHHPELQCQKLESKAESCSQLVGHTRPTRGCPGRQCSVLSY